MALPFQKELEKYKNIDEDELLGKLSEEELKQLENVLDDLDPKVSDLIWRSVVKMIHDKCMASSLNSSAEIP